MVDIKLTREQEDYFISIYELEESFGISHLTLLAKIMKYSTGAVNDEINRFEKMGLVKKIPYKGIVLSDKGMILASNVVKKHRIAEAFLYNILNVPWEKCHILSSDFEHAINGQLEKFILKKLKNLSTCPHGNPFSIKEQKDEIRLIDADLKVTYKVQRITFEELNILTKFKTFGIKPNENIKLIEKNSEGAIVLTRKGRFILDNNDLLVIRVKE